MTKAEKAAAEKKAAAKAAKEAPAIPKVSPEDTKKAALLARIRGLKTQDASGHEVSPAQLDELIAMIEK